jgi:hypothetical protein
LGARDQEDRDSSTAQTNGLQDLILKIPNAKKGWQSGLRGRKEEKKEGRKKRRKEGMLVVALEIAQDCGVFGGGERARGSFKRI